jgi:hypothetical protein
MHGSLALASMAMRAHSLMRMEAVLAATDDVYK